MPGGDGTGPFGQGPMTGRGKGFCVLQIDEHDPTLISGFAGINGGGVRMKLSNSNQQIRKEAAMPRGDGTGPMGMGPMTGRAAGFCAGYGVPGYMNSIPGRGFHLRQGYGVQVGMGFGRGRGFWGGGGRGWRNRFYATGLPGWAQYGMAYGEPYEMPYANAPAKEQELGMLKGQAENFEAALGDIRKRLQELETEKASE